MSKKNIINVLLVAALLFVIYSSINRTQHGDGVTWVKEHGEIANRRGNPDRYCIKCHTKKMGQTKENFCNTCHKQSSVKLVALESR